MSLYTSVFMAAAMSLHPALPPEPRPLPEHRPMLASRTPRIVGAPEEIKSLRRLRRSPNNSIFGWHGGPYAL